MSALYTFSRYILEEEQAAIKTFVNGEQKKLKRTKKQQLQRFESCDKVYYLLSPHQNGSSKQLQQIFKTCLKHVTESNIFRQYSPDKFQFDCTHPKYFNLSISVIDFAIFQSQKKVLKKNCSKNSQQRLKKSFMASIKISEDVSIFSIIQQ
ncbi:hypothetical protein ABPG72_001656 [Tetrahymena utriculariae]